MINIDIVASPHRYRAPSKTKKDRTMRNEQTNKVGDEAENKTWQHRHENKASLAHRFSADHKQHALFQVGIQIDILPEAESMDDLMRNSADQGKKNSDLETESIQIDQM